MAVEVNNSDEACIVRTIQEGLYLGGGGVFVRISFSLFVLPSASFVKVGREIQN